MKPPRLSWRDPARSEARGRPGGTKGIGDTLPRQYRGHRALTALAGQGPVNGGARNQKGGICIPFVESEMAGDPTLVPPATREHTSGPPPSWNRKRTALAH